VPDGRARAAAGELCATTLDTWLIHRLTQGTTFATDTSTAARTLLFDIHRRQWDPFLLEIFGVPAGVLPEVRASAGTFGSASAPASGLAGALIAASLVDQPAAMLGQGCLEQGTVKATFGTGCFVYLNVGALAPVSRRGLLATVAWQRDGQVTYALDGGIFAAGSVVTWLREQLSLVASDSEIDALAESVADPGGVVFVPALAGLAAPHWQRRARAAWLGMDLSTTRAHLVRAAFEGIAARVVEVVRAMEEDAGLAVARLRVDGGLSASAPLMQIEADLLGVPVEVSAEPEATVMGACYLAARAIGWWSDDAEISRRVATARTFLPLSSSAERSARLERFAEAVGVVSAWRS
jgi:glycerol kinase